MSTWTIPRRITLGFISLVGLSLLLGLIGLRQLDAIKTNVEQLATNTVPSLLILSNANQRTLAAGRAARRYLLATGDSAKRQAVEADYVKMRAEAEKFSADYGPLVSDAEDGKRYAVMMDAQRVLFTATDKLMSLAREGGSAGAADAYLAEECDPAIERCAAAVSNVVDYNVTLANLASQSAERTVGWSFGIIGTTLALAGLLGGLLGWSIIRAVSKSLGLVSDTLEESAMQTAAASGQLSSSSQQLATGCSEQASSVAETSAALEQMTAMIRNTAENANKAKDFAKEARQAAQIGAQTMTEMTTAMHAIEASSGEVAKIVKNIDEIAFQTNILALNAAVEAARAGEAGAGFAVVADEVRSLAQRSAAAAKETAEKIEAAIANSRRGSLSCGKVGESLEEIVEKVASADALVAEIATAAREQSQGIQQVGLAMTQMDKVTQSNSASAEESASAAEQLNAQAKSMQGAVDLLRSLVTRASQDFRKASPVADRQGHPRRLPSVARQAIPLKRPGDPRIPMPDDRESTEDQEDRNFTSF